MDVRYLGYFLAKQVGLKDRVCSVITDVRSGRDWKDTPFSINTELGYVTTPITPRKLAAGVKPEVLKLGRCMAITPDGKAVLGSLGTVRIVDLQTGTTCAKGRLINPVVYTRTRRLAVRESAPFPIDTIHAFIYKGDLYLACVVNEQRPSRDFDPWNIYFACITPEGRILSGPNYIDHMVSKWRSTFALSIPSRVPNSPFRRSYVMYTEMFVHYVYFLDELPFIDSVDNVDEWDFLYQVMRATRVIHVEEPYVCAECGKDLSGLEYPTPYEIEPNRFGLICSDCKEKIHKPFMKENFELCLTPHTPWCIYEERIGEEIRALAEAN